MKFSAGIVGLIATVVAAQAGDPFGDAFQTAQAEVPGGQLIRGRVEAKPIGNVYGFYFWKNGVILEVEIHKQRVHKKTTAETDPVSKDVAELIGKKIGTKAKLPEGRLFEIAGESVKGAGLPGIKYENRDGKLVAVFGTTVIDAETGKVISE